MTVVARRDREDPGPESLAELDSQVSLSAAGAKDEQRLAAPQVERVLQPAQAVTPTTAITAGCEVLKPAGTGATRPASTQTYSA